jgi:hypothetical protein
VKRIIEPELLDEMRPGDPRAVASRRDICRLNTCMRHHSIMANALHAHCNGQPFKQILDLGAGDGNFLLGVASRLAHLRAPRSHGREKVDSTDVKLHLAPVVGGYAWRNIAATLLDRHDIVSPRTFAQFASLGWRAESFVQDVLNWSQNCTPTQIIITNLFLHHFPEAALAAILRAIAARAQLFIALEPRRAHWPLFCSSLVWAIGCNEVTRHDAVASVRAGFSGSELSALWPSGSKWRLTEKPAGLFSHLFIAQRT